MRVLVTGGTGGVAGTYFPIGGLLAEGFQTNQLIAILTTISKNKKKGMTKN